MDPQKSLLHRFLVNTLLVVGSILLTCIILEITLRIIAHFDHNYLDRLVSSKELTDPQNNKLSAIVRLHPDSKIVFELRPNLKGFFTGQSFSTNSLGMRDVERNPVKSPGTLRIIALGDSHTFGWGVPQEEAWPAVLEKMLSENYPGREFEVMNLAVPGYNTVQEVQAFLTKGRKYDPDMVIINYIDNDMDLPNFLASPPDPLSLRSSYLLDFVKRRLDLLKGEVLSPRGLYTIPIDNRTMRFRIPMERVPERFRPLYGYENMINAFRELARECRKMGIPYVLLINFDDYRHRLKGRTPTVVLPAARKPLYEVAQEGYLVVNPEDRIFSYLKENNLGYKAIWVSDKDPHSNTIRHRLMAEELFEKLAEANLLKPLN